MAEINQTLIDKLCWLVAQQYRAETAYHRSLYKVNYYKKIQRKLKAGEQAKPWSLSTIADKIEAERLASLSVQQDMVAIKQRLIVPIARAREDVHANIYTDYNGRTGEIWVYNKEHPFNRTHELDSAQILRRADEYEANEALAQALNEEDNAADV